MKDLGNLQNWTKTDLARVVIRRLVHGADWTHHEVAADHPEVMLLVKRERKPRLIELAEIAIGP